MHLVGPGMRGSEGGWGGKMSYSKRCAQSAGPLCDLIVYAWYFQDDITDCEDTSTNVVVFGIVFVYLECFLMRMISILMLSEVFSGPLLEWKQDHSAKDATKGAKGAPAPK